MCFWILVWASASASLSESLNLSFSHTLVLPGLSLPRCPFCLKHTLTHALTHRHPLPRASHSPTVQLHFLSSGSPSCRQGWGACLTLRQGHAHLEQRQQVLDIALDALGNAWVLGVGGVSSHFSGTAGCSPRPVWAPLSPGSSQLLPSRPSACPGAPARLRQRQRAPPPKRPPWPASPCRAPLPELSGESGFNNYHHD